MSRNRSGRQLDQHYQLLMTSGNGLPEKHSLCRDGQILFVQ